ncbi:MAG: 50S ribosomal protein L3 [Candidatus Buchananbacteria bacterium RIFCSPHIGHO2_02_FULL_40_13]|uniref:Large ribosomal subunit protein uL3 n=1 Tax=Candidatus Buchananbacteria bacterium RIFCSPLOWO2_01_FULL_39_33 TaxID=1797543 RepID=A0A1G1YN19_9BACT|nr:MAG: 50S ribosomal protein L3 [Candidatus Buchananbacteria bacterium RIFCSPHIGHO2_01_FULL_40_35]OGY50569.1 MAG: 50S ribosomal protein L3 [Candidatus Buchananbacteria bacterium RIFCSPHIGHO2_02_FULL_40_13]OGY53040.1 MAG: 50S ribosomal protein L3 [Candidatus Buchananbacteria bacterium RIFCSPLOWO2_01_FULL_39_33]
MKFILGKKLAMTQIFGANGQAVPVTAVLAEPNIVAQVKTADKDKYSAVQVGFGAGKNLNKPQAGHLKGLDHLKIVREFRISPAEAVKLKRGDRITVDVFKKDDKVKVVGTSKGRGYQGVVKRHGFHGSPASHGHKDQLRKSGSIGATDPARVFKGMRMAGRMGHDQISVLGLAIVDIDQEKNILYIKGAVPGARNGLLLISAPGEMKIQASQKTLSAQAGIKQKNTEEQKPTAEAIEEAKSETATEI